VRSVNAVRAGNKGRGSRVKAKRTKAMSQSKTTGQKKRRIRDAKVGAEHGPERC